MVQISDSLYQRSYLKFQKLPTEIPGKLLFHSVAFLGSLVKSETAQYKLKS